MKLNKSILIRVVSIVLPLVTVNTVFAKQCERTTYNTFQNPTYNGLRVDKCVQGDNWGLFDSQRCDKTRQKIVANAYCKSKGHEKFVNIPRYRTHSSTHIGNHSIATFVKGQINPHINWTQVAGSDAFKKISCSKKIKEQCPPPKKPIKISKTFTSPTYKGLAIDKCVQGAGWGLWDPQRCDQTRQKIVANTYCKIQNIKKGSTKKFKRTVSFTLKNHVGNHSIVSFSKNNTLGRKYQARMLLKL